MHTWYQFPVVGFKCISWKELIFFVWIIHWNFCGWVLIAVLLRLVQYYTFLCLYMFTLQLDYGTHFVTWSILCCNFKWHMCSGMLTLRAPTQENLQLPESSWDTICNIACSLIQQILALNGGYSLKKSHRLLNHNARSWDLTEKMGSWEDRWHMIMCKLMIITHENIFGCVYRNFVGVSGWML
jgi:hypothetical protein